MAGDLDRDGDRGDVERAFQRLVAGLDYPMFVVTAAADGRRSGCLVGFATQCSIHPPRFAVWLSKKNDTCRTAVRAGALGVHALGPGDEAPASLFGHETGDRVDKLSRCGWRPGPRGVPVIEGCETWFAGGVVNRVDGGDHLGFLLEPVAVAVGGSPVGLGFQAVRQIEPGHEA